MAEVVAQGSDGIASLATPVFDITAVLSRLPSDVDVAIVRQMVVDELRRFERIALGQQISQESIRIAHYFLSATIDDIVLSQKWGSASGWAQSSLVWMFHRDTTSGDRFYDLLSKLLSDAQGHRGVLLIAFGCLAVGFEGRLRLHPQRESELGRMRVAILNALGVKNSDQLSAQTLGVSLIWKRPLLKTSFVAAIGAVLFFIPMLMMVLFWFLLDGKATSIVQSMNDAPPQPPASIHFKVLTVTERIAGFLEDEIKSNLVAVEDSAFGTVVRIRNRGIFASGAATINPDLASMFDRIAQSIAREKQPVLVVGYTDNQAISTSRFPSNIELSLARAQAVADLLGQRIPKSYISVDGRGASEPIDSNETEKGREANRRTEIQVRWRVASP